METIVGRARPPGAPRTARRTVPTKYERLKVVVRGAVQGVGFRPFVYRVATELKLKGYVSNTAQGVFIEVEGHRDLLEQFQRRIQTEMPPRAIAQSTSSSFLDAIGYGAFEICESEERGDKTAFILPDIATCVDCLREILDPDNRRFRYPFTNCTNCGPRFSIIEALPYDRSNTSMKKFAMCDACAREYHDPLDRRFHAQPNACSKCGPHLELWNQSGGAIAMRDDALRAAAEAVHAGKIIAVKGLGGFQLMVDARNEAAVVRLRERKHREEKPFALMYPSLSAVRVDCEVSQLEERLLLSSEAPIVLLRQNCRASASLAPATGAVALKNVSPGNPNLGVMLPYSPLHHLLMRELNFPVVATSGNLSDEPICTQENDALQRLQGIADLFLVHDRPIVRHVDDSVVRVMCGREMLLRRARGYAPLPIATKSAIGNRQSAIGLAVGAHLKNTVALKIDNNIFVSQHIGDLETKEAYAAFRRTCADLPRLYDANIHFAACDMHPDYLSTKHCDDLADRAGSSLPAVNGAQSPRRASCMPRPTKIQVQHHWAHLAACMAENQIEAPALGVVWDGTGYGLDGTIWGGEFLLANGDGSFDRVAHFRQFRLPGGDRAMKEPRRSALGLLYEIFGENAWDVLQQDLDFSETEKSMLVKMLEKQINAPLTSSAGRLFDAVASLTGLRQRASFEGQAAMELEFARQLDVRDAYPFRIEQARPMKIDWGPMIREILADVDRNESSGVISAKFHNALAEMIVAVTKTIGEQNVVLTGGCFQNWYLTERAVARLREERFTPYWHQQIPPNDGGIALGQAVAASWRA
jgi:hydrogenase maturation protein HypF